MALTVVIYKIRARILESGICAKGRTLKKLGGKKKQPWKPVDSNFVRQVASICVWSKKYEDKCSGRKIWQEYIFTKVLPTLTLGLKMGEK